MPYIDHLQSVTSEIIHHGNPMGVNLSSKLCTDHFDDFYKRITNSCDGLDVLAMKIARIFLADSPQSLLQFTPTHSYLGQICSVQSKCFAVSSALEDELFSLQEIPFASKSTVVPKVMIAHLIKIGSPSMSKPARIYFGLLPTFDIINNDDIKAAIRKQSFDVNDLQINLPYFDLFVPYDDDALSLVRDIIDHKISSVEGTLGKSTTTEKSKDLSKRFGGLLQFFQSQWLPSSSHTHDRSMNKKVPSVTSPYVINEVSNCADRLWTSFIENIEPHNSANGIVSENNERLRAFRFHAKKNDFMDENPHIKRSDKLKKCRPECKLTLLSDSKKWDALKTFYAQ